MASYAMALVCAIIIYNYKLVAIKEHLLYSHMHNNILFQSMVIPVEYILLSYYHLHAS